MTSAAPLRSLDEKPLPPWLRVPLTIVLVLGVYGVGVSGFAYTHYLAAPFLAYGLLGIVFVVARVRHSWMDLLWVALGVVSLVVLDQRILGYRYYFLALCSFVGLSSLLVLGIRGLWQQRRRRYIALYAFLPSALLALGAVATSFFLTNSTRLHPKTMDLYLLSADGSLGMPISFWVGQLFDSPVPLRTLAVAYDILLLPMALVYSRQLPDVKRARNALLAFVLAGPIGALCYLVVPGTGPLFLFGDQFPSAPPTVASLRAMTLHPLAVSGDRNAMPSLHVAWMVLAYWNTYRCATWLRIVVGVLLALTLLATLALGQHYFMDVIVAVPFALAIQSLASSAMGTPRSGWRESLAIGVGLVALWMALITYGTSFLWVSPAIPWLLVVGTIAVSLWSYSKLRDLENQWVGSERTTQRFI
jgi:hypothetical protein